MKFVTSQGGLGKDFRIYYEPKIIRYVFSVFSAISVREISPITFTKYPGGDMPKQNQHESKSGLAGLIRLAGPHKVKLIISSLLAILGEGFGIVPFFMIYYIVAEISGKPLADVEHRLIWMLVSAGIAAVILKYLTLGVSTLLSHKSAYNILYDLRINISKKLATLHLGYFNKRNTGQIKKVMLEDVEQMEIFLAHNIPDFVGAVVYIIMTAIVLFVVDWRLALATIIVVPIGFLVQYLTMSRNKGLRRDYFTANENMNSTMIQYIQGMPIIKAFNHTVESFNMYSESVRNCTLYEDELTKRWFMPMTIFTVCVQANLLLLLPLGATMYLAGAITLEKFVLFLLMGLGFGNPLMVLMYFGSFMDKNLEGQARIDAILNAEPLSEPVDPRSAGNGVIGRDIQFGYNGNGDVLKGIDFEVPAGKFMALVGPSGAGKTTLARLIPRFWDVDAGAISLGDTDIRDMKLDALMDKITFVFQNIYLFNDTVYENIKMGRPKAGRLEVEEAARAAQCHDLIIKLPNGYNSIVGEKGVKLSGGEKQRLSIARALLKDAPVIVLDEATSFIDPENESLIQEAINQLARHKTLIVIAHRLSTIIAADEIMVIDNGQVAARGTHQELLAHSELYKNMWEAHMSARGWTL